MVLVHEGVGWVSRTKVCYLFVSTILGRILLFTVRRTMFNKEIEIGDMTIFHNQSVITHNHTGNKDFSMSFNRCGILF